MLFRSPRDVSTSPKDASKALLGDFRLIGCLQSVKWIKKEEYDALYEIGEVGRAGEGALELEPARYEEPSGGQAAVVDGGRVYDAVHESTIARLGLDYRTLDDDGDLAVERHAYRGEERPRGQRERAQVPPPPALAVDPRLRIRVVVRVIDRLNDLEKDFGWEGGDGCGRDWVRRGT